MIAFPSVEVGAEYSVYSGSSLSAPASGPTYTLYRNGTALTLGGGGTTGWTGVSISTVTITTGAYIAKFTPPALSGGVLAVGDVLALRVDTGSTGAEFIGSWTVDNTTASRVAAGGEVALADGAITAAKIAAAAFNGKGDWNTTTPPTAVAISTQVAADLAAAHGSGTWTTATGFSTLTQADIRQAVGLTAANIDTQISGLDTKLNTIDDFIDTEVAAIKAKTDNLPTDPADASDIAAAFSTVNTKLDTIDDFLDTEVAAIKAKTDNLPADPADASDIAAAFSTVNTKLDTIDDFLDTEIAAMKVVTDKYGTMVVQDGLVYQFTANALENGPAGGGGGSTVAVYPLNATMPARVYDLNLTFYKNEDGTVVGPVSVTSRNANVFEPVDLSGRILSVRFVDYEGTELLTVANGDISVSGADNNQISFPVTSDLTGSVTETPQDQWHIWTLHDLTSGDDVLIGGKARVLLC